MNISCRIWLKCYFDLGQTDLVTKLFFKDCFVGLYKVFSIDLGGFIMMLIGFYSTVLFIDIQS